MAYPCDSNISPNLSALSNTMAPTTITLSDSQKNGVKREHRCNMTECKKKLTLSDFDCKCGFRYCGKHRHYTDHACSFNYRQEADMRLTKQLVKCDGTKLEERV